MMSREASPASAGSPALGAAGLLERGRLVDRQRIGQRAAGPVPGHGARRRRAGDQRRADPRRPHLAGVLRLAVPALVALCGGRKRFCITTGLFSGLALAALPATACSAPRAAPAAILAAMVALWCLYQLCEFLGMVALWSWLADLAPQEVPVNFSGGVAWLAGSQAAAMLAGAAFAWTWSHRYSAAPRALAYAVPILLGTALIMAAVLPLAALPAADAPGTPARRAALRRPWTDRRFLRLLAIGCWISVVNGLIQSPQNIFPNRVLAIDVSALLALKVGLRLGQWPIAPALGRWADRAGNRRLLAASLLVVAQGPLFYFLATPERPWWIAGAWICWVAWAGLNIGIPNLMLKLAPPAAATSYLAAYFGVTGLCHGVSTILGGTLFDGYRGVRCRLPRSNPGLLPGGVPGRVGQHEPGGDCAAGRRGRRKLWESTKLTRPACSPALLQRCA